MLPLFEVHQPRSIVCENGIENSALQVREEQRVAQTVTSQAETEAARDSRAVEQGVKGRQKRRSNQADSAAVKVWRETFKLNLKLGFKIDIDVTVTNLDAWRSLLNEWKEKKWNPLSIKEQLSEYERRQSNSYTRSVQQPPQRRTNAENNPDGLPERRDSRVSVLRQRERVDARTGGQTLDDILAQALSRVSKTG